MNGLFVLGVLAALLAPRDEEKERPPARVVVLADEYGDEVRGEKREVYRALVGGLEDGLEALGNGDEVRVLSFERNKDLIEPRIAEAAALEPGVVLALGSSSLRILLARRSQLGAPLAFMGVLHPEVYLGGAGDVPGTALEVDGRIQVALVRRYLPGTERIGVIHHPTESAVLVGQLREGARLHGGEIVARTADAVAEAVRLVDELERLRVDVFLLVPDRLLVGDTLYQRMRQASVRRDIPIVTPSRRHLLDDALLSIEIDYARVGRDTAEVVDRLLDGDSPEEIGVVRQTVPFLGFNERIARALGLAISPELLRRAGVVVH